MFEWLFRRKRKNKKGESNGNYIHKYPPFPAGIPYATLDYILDSQNEIIEDIIKALGLAGKHNLEKAQRMVIDPIKHYAALVHLLPASADTFYKSTGGLFRFGLECGLNAIRTANRRVLSRSSPEERKRMEELWTYAAFLGGVYSEAVTSISMVSVYSDGGHSWHPGAESLMAWLNRLNVKSYQITWSNAPDRNMAKTIAGKTIAEAQAQHLASGEKEILSTLMSALFDINDLNNPIARIINGIRTRMIMKDLAGDSHRYGKPVAGMHLAPWLIDSMRHLLASQHWRVNEGMGRVWYGLDGVYLVWPLAANDIRVQLKTNNSPFVPSTIEILAEILMGADIIVSNGDDNSYVFDIGVPQAESEELKYFSAVRLINPEVLFREQRSSMEPLKMVLGVKASEIVDVSDWVEVEEGNITKNIDTRHGDSMVRDVVEAVPKVIDKEASNTQNVSDLPQSSPVFNRYDDDYGNQYSQEQVVYDENVINGNGSELEGLGTAEAIRILTGKSKISIEKKRTNSINENNGMNLSLFSEEIEKNQGSRKVNEKKRQLTKGVDRGQIILSSLRTVKKKHITKLPEGITKVLVKGVEEVGLDPKDCVSALKKLNILIQVDGDDVGVDSSKGGDKLYFLIREDLDGA